MADAGYQHLDYPYEQQPQLQGQEQQFVENKGRSSCSRHCPALPCTALLTSQLVTQGG